MPKFCTEQLKLDKFRSELGSKWGEGGDEGGVS